MDERAYRVGLYIKFSTAAECLVGVSHDQQGHNEQQVDGVQHSDAYVTGSSSELPPSYLQCITALRTHHRSIRSNKPTLTYSFVSILFLFFSGRTKQILSFFQTIPWHLSTMGKLQ